MARTALSHSKIPTKIPQLWLAEGGEAAPAKARARHAPRGATTLVNGDLRRGTRGEDRVVVEVEGGVTVYPARHPGDRWRAVWYENGRRRQCQAASEDGLAARLEKITFVPDANARAQERTRITRASLNRPKARSAVPTDAEPVRDGRQRSATTG